MTSALKCGEEAAEPGRTRREQRPENSDFRVEMFSWRRSWGAGGVVSNLNGAQGHAREAHTLPGSGFQGCIL